MLPPVAARAAAGKQKLKSEKRNGKMDLKFTVVSGVEPDIYNTTGVESNEV
jgi:hypothetical protein